MCPDLKKKIATITKRGIKKCLELTNFQKRNAGEYGLGFSCLRTTADSQVYNEEMDGLFELEAAASWDPHEVSGSPFKGLPMPGSTPSLLLTLHVS